MIVRKNITLTGILRFAGHHLWWLITYMLLVSVLYKVVGWHWISIPWLPVSLVGTALAFYIGFKNNQSYDRVWEARKIWGAIVNSSRSWGAMVNSFVRNNHSTHYSAQEIQQIKQQLIYRHIAWLYILREQLLVPTQWEHSSLKGLYGALAKKRIETAGLGLFKNYLSDGQKQNIFLMTRSSPRLPTRPRKSSIYNLCIWQNWRRKKCCTCAASWICKKCCPIFTSIRAGPNASKNFRCHASMPI